jgi:DNA-binding transcriptional regulator of glucitol operon
MNEKTEYIKKLIAAGEILEAISALKLIDSFNANDILMLESRYRQNEKEIIKGIVKNQDSDLVRNQIVESLVKIISITDDDNEEHSFLKENRKKVIEKDLVVKIIKSQNNSIRIYSIVAAIPILLAISFTAWSFYQDTMGTIQTLGALLVGSLSGFPIKEIVSRTEKISVLKLLILKIEALIIRPYDQDEIEKVNKVFWNMLESSLLK